AKDKKVILVTKGYGYRVWYWLNNELHVIACGLDGKYAWRIVESYHEPYLHYHPSYLPWLEYIKE
ncbi:unnamed protein product, partial [marine sediment metagenome]